MPEYLMRRTSGVVGVLERLIEDGAQDAMDSGKELLDEIAISLDDPSRDPSTGEIPPIPGKGTSSITRKTGGQRKKNTTFDDRGPSAADAAS
jgi:hypothetical protein